MATPRDLSNFDPDHVSDDVGYLVSQRVEPHSVRRRELLRERPEIRELFGYDRKTAYWAVVLVIVQLTIAGGLGYFAAPWWAILLTAYFIGAVANHWQAMIIHEASHNSAWPGGPTPNRIVALIANTVILFPSAMSFRRYHHHHHRYLGVENLDNDLPTPLEARIVGTCRTRKVLWYLFFPLVAIFARGFLRKPDRWEVVNVVVQVVVVSLIAMTLGWVALAYLALSTFFGSGLHPVAAHWVHEHYTFEEDQETHSYYGPLNKVACNVGYHVEHHDFPGIPGSQLPKLHSMARDWYEPLAREHSWVRVLWRFVTDSSMGHHRRVVRSYSTYKSAGVNTEKPLERACRAGVAA